MCLLVSWTLKTFFVIQNEIFGRWLVNDDEGKKMAKTTGNRRKHVDILLAQKKACSFMLCVQKAPYPMSLAADASYL